MSPWPGSLGPPRHVLEGRALGAFQPPASVPAWHCLPSALGLASQPALLPLSRLPPSSKAVGREDRGCWGSPACSGPGLRGRSVETEQPLPSAPGTSTEQRAMCSGQPLTRLQGLTGFLSAVAGHGLGAWPCRTAQEAAAEQCAQEHTQAGEGGGGGVETGLAAGVPSPGKITLQSRAQCLSLGAALSGRWRSRPSSSHCTLTMWPEKLVRFSWLFDKGVAYQPFPRAQPAGWAEA